MQRNPEQMPITADCQSVVGPPTPRYSEYFDTRFRKGRPVNQTELADFLRNAVRPCNPKMSVYSVAHDGALQVCVAKKWRNWLVCLLTITAASSSSPTWMR